MEDLEAGASLRRPRAQEKIEMGAPVVTEHLYHWTPPPYVVPAGIVMVALVCIMAVIAIRRT
jgi:hypothetical protein